MKLDKIAHFLAGTTVALLLAPFGPLSACIAVLVAAIGKEVFDHARHDKPDMADAAATMAGGAVGIAAFALIQGIA